MKRWLVVLTYAACSAVTVHGEGTLTSAQIELLQKDGLITPEFENAAQQWIRAHQAAADAKTGQSRAAADLPELQKKVEEEDAKVARLQAELAHYTQPDETDFIALQQAMKDPNSRPEGQLARAQAYAWTYPDSPHLADAERDLQQLQKQMADQQQAARDVAAAATAAQIKLLQRVKARDLNLGEWRAFLQDKSQSEVMRYLGAPATQDDEHWVYQGEWTLDPATNQRAGLQLTFNGGRVQNVAPVSNPVPPGSGQ